MRDATRKQLADYKAVFSHTNIPQNDPEYEQLRNWVNNQKSQYIVQWFNQFISANVLLVGGSALIIRFSVDLKDQGRILAHQFNSLPVHLQEILLRDPCFVKAEAVRIHMYANLVEKHNLAFLIVSD